jgi:hypothetical protein
MIMWASLWMCRTEGKHGSLLPSEPGSELGARNASEGGWSFADSCYHKTIDTPIPGRTIYHIHKETDSSRYQLTLLSLLHLRSQGLTSCSCLFLVVALLSEMLCLNFLICSQPALPWVNPLSLEEMDFSDWLSLVSNWILYPDPLEFRGSFLRHWTPS